MRSLISSRKQTASYKQVGSSLPTTSYDALTAGKELILLLLVVFFFFFFKPG